MVQQSITHFINSPREILNHILLVAKKAGYCFGNQLDEFDAFSVTSFNEETGRMVVVLKSRSSHQLIYDSIYLLFFDTSFARALFGTDWETHLIQMSQTRDKLGYIANHLNLNNYAPSIG